MKYIRMIFAYAFLVIATIFSWVGTGFTWLAMLISGGWGEGDL